MHSAGCGSNPFWPIPAWPELAGGLRDIALGIVNVILPLHHPAHVATAAAFVDWLPGGRLLLEVASGDRPEEYPALGMSFPDRDERFRESLAYIRAMAADFPTYSGNHGHIDILVNNAGVYKTPNPILPNGQEVRLVVNTLAPHVLTTALLPILPSDGRVINLFSAAQVPVDAATLSGGRHLDDMGAYAQSKRAIALWSAEKAGQRSEPAVRHQC